MRCQLARGRQVGKVQGIELHSGQRSSSLHLHCIPGRGDEGEGNCIQLLLLACAQGLGDAHGGSGHGAALLLGGKNGVEGAGEGKFPLQGSWGLLGAGRGRARHCGSEDGGRCAARPFAHAAAAAPAAAAGKVLPCAVQAVKGQQGQRNHCSKGEASVAQEGRQAGRALVLARTKVQAKRCHHGKDPRTPSLHKKGLCCAPSVLCDWPGSSSSSSGGSSGASCSRPAVQCKQASCSKHALLTPRCSSAQHKVAPCSKEQHGEKDARAAAAQAAYIAGAQRIAP